MSQKRHWMITLFPKMDIWAKEDVLALALKSMLENLPNVRYSIFQIEISPTTNKIHVQLYVEFKKSYRFSKVKKLMDFEGFSKPHLEIRKHSRESCRAYCSKSESRLEGLEPIEIGIWRETSRNKKDNSFRTCAELIELGWDEIDIAGKRPELFLRYGNRIKDLISHRKLYYHREQKRKRLLSEAKDNEQE